MKMLVKIRDKEVELGFTFNSFKYMEEFDITALDEIEQKPFKIVPLIEMLMLGALNKSPREHYTDEDVMDYLEEFIVDGDTAELLAQLMALLEESNFFKSLQKKTPQKKKK